MLLWDELCLHYITLQFHRLSRNPQYLRMELYLDIRSLKM